LNVSDVFTPQMALCFVLKITVDRIVVQVVYSMGREAPFQTHNFIWMGGLGWGIRGQKAMENSNFKLEDGAHTILVGDNNVISINYTYTMIWDFT